LAQGHRGGIVNVNVNVNVSKIACGLPYRVV
jgi:hypothetical protein